MAYTAAANAAAREALRLQLLIARVAQAADGQVVTDLMKELEK